MASLAEIRAKLKEQETRSNSGPVDNAIFPFWNMKEGDTSIVRFLPDGDVSNDFFWRERLMIKLPFAGVKGQTDSRPVQVQVPCMEMYGELCPVLSEVRAWFKDPTLEDQGRKYWKKRSYIFQNFIVDNALKDDAEPENPIRRSIIGPQIFQIIKAALLDPEMEELPTDYTHGLDFRLTKTSKGGFADYSTSTWARRERPLNEKEMAAISTHGLHTLNDFLPKRPNEVEVKVISQMFEASVDGEAFDMDKFGQYYRPAGMSAATGDPVKKTVTVTKAPTVTHDDDDTPPFDVTSKKTVEPTKSAHPSDEAQDILKMIRDRQRA